MIVHFAPPINEAQQRGRDLQPLPPLNMRTIKEDAG